MSLLIAIEGIDGSGKGTQAMRLCDRLVQSGRSTRLISFPRYSETFFGRAIGEFLNGKFGTLEQVHPFLVSLLFAGDRAESRDLLRAALADNEVVVLDRYVASNVAHQASKLDGQERSALAQRILDLEYNIHALPRPDLVVLLDLPVPLAQQLIAKKSARSYTSRAADLQEADANYLARVREMYLELAREDPRWRIVAVNSGNSPRPIEEISDEVWSVLPARE